MFSTAGNIVSEKRTRIRSDLVSAYIILKENWDQIEEYCQNKKRKTN